MAQVHFGELSLLATLRTDLPGPSGDRVGLWYGGDDLAADYELSAVVAGVDIRSAKLENCSRRKRGHEPEAAQCDITGGHC